MSRLSKVLVSSIGKKYVMGMTGLLLCGFLVSHLLGNLLIYEGRDEYNAYSAKLHALGPLLLLAEIGLLVLFLVHIALAFWLTIDNYRARGRDQYELRESKQNTSIFNAAPRSWMFISGSVILAFLVLHMIDMRFGLRDQFTEMSEFTDLEHKDVYEAGEGETGRPALYAYERAVAVLRTPLSAIVYVVGVTFLGFHLSHGFASAFRSLGLAHPAYTPWIHRFSVLFAILIAVGFASIPIYIWAFDVPVPSPEVPVDEETKEEALHSFWQPTFLIETADALS